MNTKKLTFAIMMGALGSALFALSYYMGPIASGIALDFSLIAVLIAGFYAGPTTGALTGIIAGILPGIMFGPLGLGGVAGLIGLPLGKALTGITSGTLSKSLNLQNRSSIIGIPSTFIAYIPEAIFTFGYFAFLMGSIAVGGNLFLTAILPKALVEITIMSVIIAALMGNNGFNCFIKQHFTFSQRKCKK